MSGDGGHVFLKLEKRDEVGEMVGAREVYSQGSRGAARDGGGEVEPCEFG